VGRDDVESLKQGKSAYLFAIYKYKKRGLGFREVSNCHNNIACELFQRGRD